MRMDARFEGSETGPLLFEQGPIQLAAHCLIRKRSAAERNGNDKAKSEVGLEDTPVCAPRKQSHPAKYCQTYQTPPDTQRHATCHKKNPAPRRPVPAASWPDSSERKIRWNADSDRKYQRNAEGTADLSYRRSRPR